MTTCDMRANLAPPLPLLAATNFAELNETITRLKSWFSCFE